MKEKIKEPEIYERGGFSVKRSNILIFILEMILKLILRLQARTKLRSGCVKLVPNKPC